VRVTELPGLLVFAAALAPVEREVGSVLGADGLGLLGWAWMQRVALVLDDDTLVAALPAAWRPAGRLVLRAWARAVRTTSLAERWHSLLRAHLVVHRGLSPGLLALLAVWYNHRAVARGVHAGTSPLHRSGLVEAPTDWLTVLGYSPAGGTLTPCPSRPTPRRWPPDSPTVSFV
jgi:hypothetical protein